MADAVPKTSQHNYYIFNSLTDIDRAIKSLKEKDPNLSLDALKHNCPVNGLVLTIEQEKIISDLKIAHYPTGNTRAERRPLNTTNSPA